MTIMYIYKYDKYINSDIIFGCKCPIFVYKCLIFGYKHPNKVYRLDRVCLHGMVMWLSLSVMTCLWEVWDIRYSNTSCDCRVSVGCLGMCDREDWLVLLSLVLYIQTCSMYVNKWERVNLCDGDWYCLILLNKMFIICKRNVVLSDVGYLGEVMLFVRCEVIRVMRGQRDVISSVISGEICSFVC